MPKQTQLPQTLLIAVAYKDKDIVNSIQDVGTAQSFQTIDKMITRLKDMNQATNRVDVHVLKRVNFERVQSFRV